MIDPEPPPRSTATEPPWTRRGLWWRSTWPSIILAFAAFQAGVIVTLVVVWSRIDTPRTTEMVTPAPPAPPPPAIVAPAAAPPLVTAPPAPPDPVPTPSRPARRASPARTSSALVEIEIVSEPEGATVRIAGAVWGVTPLTAFLPGDRATWIELELPDHPPSRTRWTPTSGARVLRVDLNSREHK